MAVSIGAHHVSYLEVTSVKTGDSNWITITGAADNDDEIIEVTFFMDGPDYIEKFRKIIDSINALVSKEDEEV